jgi:hypothetical protein
MQCKKLVYLDKYCSKLRTPPDAETLARFRKGRDFENAFKDLFINAIDVKQYHRFVSEKYINFTQTLLAKEGKVELFEAGILYDKVLVLTDVLRKNEDGSYDIFEVKHSEKINSAIEWDLAVQYYVCKHKLHRINTFNVVTRVNETEFIVVDKKEELEEKLETVRIHIKEFEEILQGFEPDIRMGEQCESPYSCDFQDYCRVKEGFITPKVDSLLF